MKKVIFICIFILITNQILHAGDNSLSTFSLHGSWQFRQVNTETWKPAIVPGCVHTDLFNNGDIGDPFFRMNEKELQWIEKVDWEYQYEFEISDDFREFQNIELICEGLDTYADVYLNGTLLMSSDNMFIEYRNECKGLLRKGKNRLHIYFTSPINKTMPIYETLPYRLPASNDQSDKQVSIFTRKAPYHYGWDWGPRFVTSGIWKNIYLKGYNYARFNDVQVVQEALSDSKARVMVFADVHASNDCSAEVSVVSKDSSFEKATTSVNLFRGSNTVQAEFVIENPKRWYPNGLGEQHLYELEALIEVSGALTDRKEERIGLRTIEVVNNIEGESESFYFKVNDIPVFMKGANYIPSDMFLNRVSDERYERLIKSAADANMNMLRVWGGGIYEKDIFYDLCDEYGILVFQDFMFACSMYPGDKNFLTSVKKEAEQNVKRLRNHACLAMWAGNNEIENAWYFWGWQDEFGYSKEDSTQIWQDYLKVFHSILPKVVAEHDPKTFYWASSPRGRLYPGSDLKGGDYHLWTVWHGMKPFEEFEAAKGSFFSEYGFQSFPDFYTVKQYTIPEDHDIESEVMMHHQRSDRGNQRIKEYMERDYDEPKDFESFLYVGQLLQAYGIKAAMEAHRRNMPECMGTLYWQLDDCWPVASWSGIDYYLRWKALHYFAKRAFRDILVSPYITNDSLKVSIVSDRLEECTGTLILSIVDFSGKELWKQERILNIAPNSSETHFSELVESLTDDMDRDEICLKAAVEIGDISYENILYFEKVKDLDLPEPKIQTAIKKNGNDFLITLSSSVLAKDVYLDSGDIPGFFSDNYFDLFPNEVKEIIFTPEKQVESINEELFIRTLTDAF